MLILYTTEDGKSRIQLRADENTVWLTQAEMADLFATTKQNISLHLQNILEDAELQEDSVVKESLTTAADGKAYTTKLYNLDATGALYLEYDARRKMQEALAADQADEAELKSLEAKLKRRKP